MQQTKSFKELKTNARIQMQGNIGTLMGAMLLQLGITIVVSNIVSNIVSGTDTASTVIYYVVMFIVELLLGTITAGMAYLHLKTACNGSAKIADMFYVIKAFPDKAIKIQLILTIIGYIFSIPSYIFSYMYGGKFLSLYYSVLETSLLNSNADVEGMLVNGTLSIIGNSTTLYFGLGLLLIVCGILSYIIRSLGFFPVYYMMLDFPGMSVSDIFKNAWELMKGYKARLFGLQLSFILYFVLSMFTMCIPLLWVIPYMSMTNTNFYLDLIAYKNGKSE